MKAYIKDNYYNMTYQAMADVLGISFYALSKEIGLMLASGELESKTKKWTSEDDDFVLNAYKVANRDEIAEILGTTPGNVSDRYFRLSNGLIGVTPKSLARKKERQAKRDKKIIEQYNKAIIEGKKEDKKQGLDLSQLKLKIGQNYSVKIKHRNSTEIFKGKLVQDCGRHLVFKHNKGWCECFLKADLLIKNEYEVAIK